MPFAVGETIGPYQIMDQLGQGGMATVFKAYHSALDRFVAIKAMHPVFMEDPSFLARFQREAQVVARLDHSNIVPIYDYSEFESQPYLVMRYIDGETLKARMSRGKLTPVEVVAIVNAVTDALAYAHSQGVLHRDVKPSNVLLSMGGKIYLADFGLARMAQAGQSTLSSDVMLGTPQYISPEQARGSMDLDAGTDIYSFGVMLFEIVTGRVPFNADTPYSIIHDHIYTPLPLPRSINPEISPEVEQVLLKALAKERGDRFETVRQLGVAFLRAWESENSQKASSETVGSEVPVAGDSLPQEVIAVDPLPAGAGMNGVRTPDVGDVDFMAVEAPYLEVNQEPAGEYDARQTLPDGGESDLASQVRERLQAKPSIVAPKARRSGNNRLRWWVLLPAVIAICICSFFGMVLIRGIAVARSGEESPRNGGLAPPSVQEGQSADRVDSSVPSEGSGNLPSPSGELPPGTEGLPAAQHRVNENPGDPMGYLQLALAYFDAGDDLSAQEALVEGGAIAGDGYPGYYVEGANELAKREKWLPSALFYSKLIQSNPGEVTPVLRDQAERAAYLGMSDPDARTLLNLLGTQDGIDVSLIETLQARFQLYQGNPRSARNSLERILKDDPGFGPALLLQAEVSLNLGENSEAIRILEQLAGGGSPRSWVSEIAGQFLGAI